MNARRCLEIASRIGTLLEQEIGVGVDAKRMLTERLYMRDVLLVCDAHRGSEMAQLATWFRRASAEVPAAGVGPSGFGQDSGFGPSEFGHSGFGPSGFGSSTFDRQRAGSRGMNSFPSPAALVRHQLEQQRAAARHGAWLAAARSAGR